MLWALEQQKSDDQRTLGELFFFLVDEMADITFTRSLCILMDALMASLQEILKLIEEQFATFTAYFISRLPQYLQAKILNFKVRSPFGVWEILVNNSCHFSLETFFCLIVNAINAIDVIVNKINWFLLMGII